MNKRQRLKCPCLYVGQFIRIYLMDNQAIKSGTRDFLFSNFMSWLRKTLGIFTLLIIFCHHNPVVSYRAPEQFSERRFFLPLINWIIVNKFQYMASVSNSRIKANIRLFFSPCRSALLWSSVVFAYTHNIRVLHTMQGSYRFYDR